MRNTHTLRAKATLTAQAPLFVSQPDSCRFPTCEKKYVPASLRDDSVFSRLNMPAISNGKPYVIGTTPRGALRMHSYKEMVEALDEINGEMHTSRFAQMIIDTKGGVTVPKSENLSYGAIDQIRDQRLMLDAFGGNTPAFIGGRLMVGGLYPVSEDYELTPLPVNRKNPIRSQSDLIRRVVDPQTIIEWEQSGRETSKAGADIRALKAQFKKETDEGEKAKIKQAIDTALRAQADAKNIIAAARSEDVLAAPAEALTYVHTQPSDYQMAFPAGLVYNHMIHINDAPLKTIGLILAGMKSWQAMGIVGGKSAAGAGGFLIGDYVFEFWNGDDWQKFGAAEFAKFKKECHEAFLSSLATADHSFLG